MYPQYNSNKKFFLIEEEIRRKKSKVSKSLTEDSYPYLRASPGYLPIARLPCSFFEL
jgi:hypothetical protein